MALRLVALYALADLTLAFNYTSNTTIRNSILTALQNDGWNIVNVSVSSADSLASPNQYQINIQANVDNAYSDEYTRQRLTQILANVQMVTNYGVYTTSPYPMFSSVQVQIISNNPNNGITQISPQAVQDNNSFIKNTGLDGFLSGAGITTPLVIGGLLVFLVLYLRK